MMIVRAINSLDSLSVRRLAQNQILCRQNLNQPRPRSAVSVARDTSGAVAQGSLDEQIKRAEHACLATLTQGGAATVPVPRYCRPEEREVVHTTGGALQQHCDTDPRRDVRPAGIAALGQPWYNRGSLSADSDSDTAFKDAIVCMASRWSPGTTRQLLGNLAVEVLHVARAPAATTVQQRQSCECSSAHRFPVHGGQRRFMGVVRVGSLEPALLELYLIFPTLRRHRCGQA